MQGSLGRLVGVFGATGHAGRDIVRSLCGGFPGTRVVYGGNEATFA